MRSPWGGINPKVLHFKVKNTPLNRKRKLKRMLSSLFGEEGKLFIKKLSFEEFNLVIFMVECMVCFEMQPRQQSFCQILLASILNKHFQEMASLSIVLSSFIHKAQNTIVILYSIQADTLHASLLRRCRRILYNFYFRVSFERLAKTI